MQQADRRNEKAKAAKQIASGVQRSVRYAILFDEIRKTPLARFSGYDSWVIRSDKEAGVHVVYSQESSACGEGIYRHLPQPRTRTATATTRLAISRTHARSAP